MDVVRERSVTAAMPDGTRLVADVWRPDGAGRWPVLLQRLPYGRAVASAPVLPHPVHLARRGYAVVVQDVRGRGDSAGTFDPFVHEGADTAATIEWAADLPYCDGQVVTYGFSYQGLMQLGAAARHPRGLRAIVAMQCSTEPYAGWTYEGGCLQWPFVAGWAAQLAGQEPGATPPAVDLGALPIADALGAMPPPWFRTWLDHPDRDDFWAALAPDLDAIDVPAFCVAGWNDTFAAGSSRLISKLGAQAVVGPWGHIPWGSDFGGRELGPDAGPQHAHDALLAFLDRVCKGIGTRSSEPVRYYTVGAGWRSAAAWPPPVAVETWSTSGGNANSRHGNGQLGPGAPGEHESDVLAAEPLVPVPGALEPFSDESALEDRRDVLCFTSAPMPTDRVITGVVTARLRTRADVDTHDLVVSLTDVGPDHRSTRIATGCRRLRAVTPGALTDSTVELAPTSWLVAAGHRVRLDVSASRFPAFDRNPQTVAVAAHHAARTDCRVAIIEVAGVDVSLPFDA